MKEIVKKSIEELNELLPKQKKLSIGETTPLVGEKSSLESIDLVNLSDNSLDEAKIKFEGPYLSYAW